MFSRKSANICNKSDMCVNRKRRSAARCPQCAVCLATSQQAVAANATEMTQRKVYDIIRWEHFFPQGAAKRDGPKISIKQPRSSREGRPNILRGDPCNVSDQRLKVQVESKTNFATKIIVFHHVSRRWTSPILPGRQFVLQNYSEISKDN